MRRRLFWIFVVSQALVPVAMAGLREADVAFAPHVLLRVEPLDPRDPFRGQYVALRYDLGGALPGGIEDGATVYVPLSRAGDVWQGGYVTTSRPDDTAIRGRVRNGKIEFGIEQFYVSEGEARRYEDALREDRVYADVALGRNWRPTLRRLVIR
jgi:uncharacterized membrane-anchored protein